MKDVSLQDIVLSLNFIIYHIWVKNTFWKFIRFEYYNWNKYIFPKFKYQHDTDLIRTAGSLKRIPSTKILKKKHGVA